MAACSVKLLYDENDALRMTPVFPRHVQLLTYRIYVYFVSGTAEMLVRCVFSQLRPRGCRDGFAHTSDSQHVLLRPFRGLNTLNTFQFFQT